MPRYAESTKVPVERSKTELESLLRRYNAKNFVWATDDAGFRQALQCDMHDRRVRFMVKLPDPKDRQFLIVNDRRRTAEAARTAYQQELRRVWRSLVLVVKAKLESVESGIESFDDAFLAQVVIPETGQTIGDHMRAQLPDVYSGRSLPSPLPGLPSGER